MKAQREDSKEAYLAFQSIDPGAYRERVRFFDAHRHYFDGLSHDIFMELSLDYHRALFEIGKYQRFLDGVDPIIEYVVIDNIGGYSNDLFCELLFKKAASQYSLWHLEAAEAILRQLINIDGSYPHAAALLYQCRIRSRKVWYETVKGVSVLAFLVGVGGLLLSNLVVEPFYEAYYDVFHQGSVLLLAFCVLLLVGNEVALRLSARLDVAKHRREHSL